jgi:hypothetical protein
MANLATIITKVRRLTRSFSDDQLTDDQITDYINEFILYNMPARNRAFNFRKKFTFYTEPYVDSYTTGSTPELVNFKQDNIAVHTPFYIAGYKTFYTQSRQHFYEVWPARTTQTTIASGNNVTLNFLGTLSSIPVERGNVVFTSSTLANIGLKLFDQGTGLLSGDGGGTINYVTGAYVLNFAVAPGTAKPIIAQVNPYTPSRPTDVLFFADTFTLRPIPDKVYAVNFEVDVRPTTLIKTNPLSVPDLLEDCTYIAYGAARIVFQDRADMTSLELIEPEFREQELYVNRRTIVQLQDQRTATIFSGLTNSNFWNYGDKI